MTAPTFSIAMDLAPPDELADAMACRVYAAIVIQLTSATGGTVPFAWRCRIASLANGLAIRVAMREALASASYTERCTLAGNLALLEQHLAPIVGDVFEMITTCGAGPSQTAH